MTTQTEAQRLSKEWFSKITLLRRVELGGEMAKEMRRLEAANAELLAVLGDVWYALEKARIWGGMEWKYNPLHPVHYLPARDKARAAIAKHGGAA